APTPTGTVIAQATVVLGDNCPVLTSAMASPLTVTAHGGLIDVSATAVDADPGDTLTYQWTSTIGRVVDPVAPATRFQCAIAGEATIAVSVMDDPQPAPCAATRFFAVTCLPPTPPPPCAPGDGCCDCEQMASDIVCPTEVLVKPGSSSGWGCD